MIIVMGLPGAGKTTVLKGLKSDYRILNYGDLMLEIEKERFGIKDRDDMRKLPIEKQKEAQKLVADRLSQETGRVILDTHCSVHTPNGYFPGLPFQLLQRLKVDALVLITASTEEVIERIKSDQTRHRDVEHVHQHDMMNRAYLASYSAFSGAPAVIIINRQGKVDEAISQLQMILK